MKISERVTYTREEILGAIEYIEEFRCLWSGSQLYDSIKVLVAAAKDLASIERIDAHEIGRVKCACGNKLEYEISEIECECGNGARFGNGNPEETRQSVNLNDWEAPLKVAFTQWCTSSKE